MNNGKTDKKENITKIPLGLRLKLMFLGYKTRSFFGTVCKIVPICILAILIILVVTYIFLHPVDKIKLRYFFSRDCTIEVISNTTSRNYNGPHAVVFSQSRSEILIDGDWMEADGEYYNWIDGEVYRYYKYGSDKWQKELYEIDKSLSSDDYMLLDKNNYVRDKKNPFVWKLKEDIDKEILGMSNIRIKRVDGAIAIVGETVRNAYEVEISLCFRKFGTTKIELPWDE